MVSMLGFFLSRVDWVERSQLAQARAAQDGGQAAGPDAGKGEGGEEEETTGLLANLPPKE